MAIREQVYNLLKQIPKGQVTTYKILGDFLGTKGYRGIGQILKKNPNAPDVPCHRVVRTNGELGGYNGTETEKKIALLIAEGLQVKDNLVQNLEHYLFKDFK